MTEWSRADLAHEEVHVRALRKLGCSAKVYQDDQGLYTIQTGGRKLSPVEEAAVHLAADGGFFDWRASEDRRLAAKLVGHSGKDRREAEKLARKLRGWW